MPLPAVAEALHRAGTRVPLELVTTLGAEVAGALQALSHFDPPLVYGRLAPDQLTILEGGAVQFAEVAMRPEATTAVRDASLEAFTAPEVQRGDPPSSASDVYALARVLLWLWAGPAQGYDAALAAIQHEEPALAGLLEGALREVPEGRTALSWFGRLSSTSWSPRRAAATATLRGPPGDRCAIRPRDPIRARTSTRPCTIAIASSASAPRRPDPPPPPPSGSGWACSPWPCW